MPDSVTVSKRGSVAVIALNNPPVNGLGFAVRTNLMTILRFTLDDSAVQALVLVGSGKMFSGGADIREFGQTPPPETPTLPELINLIEASEKPIVAALHGVALGGGCELAMACTLRIAADTAKIGQPEINLGLIPGFGGTQRLPRLIGTGPALEILLTGAPISAEVAWRLGLVNRVVSADLLRDESDKLAAALAAKPPVAVKYILDAVQLGTQMSLAEGCDYEASLFGLIAATEDKQEGTRAFLEKRRAEFKGQ